MAYWKLSYSIWALILSILNILLEVKLVTLLLYTDITSSFTYIIKITKAFVSSVHHLTNNLNELKSKQKIILSGMFWTILLSAVTSQHHHYTSIIVSHDQHFNQFTCM